MKPKEKILIAGGDLRQLYCAAKLAEKYDASVIGFDDEYIPPELNLKCVTYNSDKLFDYALLPVMPVTEEELLNTPCSAKKIKISEIKSMLKPKGLVFAGKVNEKLCRLLDRADVCDYLERDELNLLNAVPTAEGAVQIALEELPVTLNRLRVLVVGMGKIGAALVNILKGFGADITVSVRNASGSAKVRNAGVKSCCTQKITGEFDLVFNTVPSMIFNRAMLERFGKNTLFIDLASKPGGIDFEVATELGIKAIWALGLPGKTAPITAGEIIADTVSGIISERSEAVGG